MNDVSYSGPIAPQQDSNLIFRKILGLLLGSMGYASDDGDLIAHVFDISAAGNNEIVAGLTGKSIRLHQLFLETAGDVNLTVKSGSNAISHVIEFLDGDKLILDPHKTPWFKTAQGQSLNFFLSGSVEVKGIVYYKEL